MKEQAKKLKSKLTALMELKWDFRVLSLREDAFHNPIALAVKQNKIAFHESERTLIQKTRDSAKLYITQSNEAILKNYFIERQEADDKLGNLYKTLSFSGFILRLWNKRFKEEAVLSSLVLPQSTSIVIGTGSRSNESTWDVHKEFEESIQLKGLGLGAFAFNHPDNKQILEDLYLESVQATIKDPDFQLQYITDINLINLPSDLANKDQVEKQANKTEPVTQQSLVSTRKLSVKSNIALFATIAAVAVCFVLAAITLATAVLTAWVALPVFIGLAGLAVVAYKKYDNQKQSSAPSQVVELNLETIVASIPKLASFSPEKPALKVIRRVMEPTKRDTLCDIGGFVVCGDSGSKFGNEGNIGLTRSSSDDPAAQYSLLDPTILDADVNSVLQNSDCVRILGNQGQSLYLEPESVPSSSASSPRPKF